MPPRFHLEYYNPPRALEGYVLTLFHFMWNEEDIRDRHPGALPQLVLFPFGTGEVQFGDRHDAIEGGAHLFSGFSTAAPFAMSGPWHAVGASLTPLGWAALTGQPANQYLDRFIPAPELLGQRFARFAQEINHAYRSQDLSGKEVSKALADWIADHLGPIPPTHRALIGQTFAWLGGSLNPDLDDLFSRAAYSRRQAERLVERYFGFPPAALARKYRAIRASALLAQADLSDEADADIAEAFHDQPHMIREIRRYCDYTPTRLGGGGEPLFETMLRMKNVDRLSGFKALE